MATNVRFKYKYKAVEETRPRQEEEVQEIEVPDVSDNAFYKVMFDEKLPWEDEANRTAVESILEAYL